jgi:hypothetical protein
VHSRLTLVRKKRKKRKKGPSLPILNQVVRAQRDYPLEDRGHPSLIRQMPLERTIITIPLLHRDMGMVMMLK